MPETLAPAPGAGRVVALVGAECTGKSTLAQELALWIRRAHGLRCAVVGEYLREWCDRQGRTPRRDEQAHVLHHQAQRIEAAQRHHDLVVADTTPLMTAVYHHQVFQDGSLDQSAQDWHRQHVHLTVLTALDLAWQPDGLQRDGPQVREPVDARLRQMMIGGGIDFSVVSGAGPNRLSAAVNAVAPLLRSIRSLPETRGEGHSQPGPRWQCACCAWPEGEQAELRARSQGLRAGTDAGAPFSAGFSASFSAGQPVPAADPGLA